jgi:hypothetical protein
VYHNHLPSKLWMADSHSPLCLGTVIWFENLEFMSLGYDYDMVLLPPRASFGVESSPRLPRHGRRSGHHSRALTEHDKGREFPTPPQELGMNPQGPLALPHRLQV